MCGRFTATFEFSDIRARRNLDRDLPLYKPRFNIAPEQVSPTIPVIVRHRGSNDCSRGSRTEGQAACAGDQWTVPEMWLLACVGGGSREDDTPRQDAFSLVEVELTTRSLKG
jgi:putative SOS response-associated peptidase YedK